MKAALMALKNYCLLSMSHCSFTSHQNNLAWVGHHSHERVGPRVIQTPSLDYGIKVDVPEFTGEDEPDVFMDWLLDSGYFFKLKPVSKDMKVLFITTHLKGIALNWWDHQVRYRVKKVQDPITTWVDMRNAMKAIFILSSIIVIYIRGSTI